MKRRGLRSKGMRRRRVNARKEKKRKWEGGGNDWDNKKESMKRKGK
jgi:hypothetical protein